MRVGVKAAWITTFGVVLTTVLILLFSKSKNGNKDSAIQKINEQKVDTGSINNYNAGGDLKVENNTYNNVANSDTVKPRIKKENPKTIVIYKDSPEKKVVVAEPKPKNQIINNAPNQGIQVNEATIYSTEAKVELTESDKQILLSAFKDKKRRILVSATMGNAKSIDFAHKIQRFLIEAGLNVDKSLASHIELVQPYGTGIDTIRYQVKVGILDKE
jgi:hypothetical protein